MAEIDAKVNMSLDDIIKMEKKKKTANPKTKRGGAPKGTVRGGKKAGTARGGKKPIIARGSTVRGNSRGRNSRPANQGFKNKRGQWKKFPQNSTRGGFIKKKFNNGTIKSNLARSRSNLSLNKLNVNNSKGPRGGFGSRRGGKFGLTRSRSRTNLVFGNNKPTFLAKNKGFLKRTNSMPNLRDPSSVHNRLGYQSPAQIAYRNRVKRAKNVLNQRQSKAMRMQNSFGLSPAGKVLSSLDRKMASSRRFTSGSLHSDQLIRTQRRAQYEQKLLRMGAARNMPSMAFMNAAFNANRQHPAMALYASSIQNPNPLMMNSRQVPRGRSPFTQSLQSLKAAAKSQRQKRARSRSRSRSRPPRLVNRNNIINLTDPNNIEDRQFSEVMYSLSNNFGVTGRTLNDRFSY